MAAQRDPVQWITTTIVLDRLREADAATWELLVLRFRAPIVQFARQLGLSLDEAEDVAQDALMDFTRAYRDGKYDRAKGRLHSWLFGIAHRRVKNSIRKAGRRPPQSPETPDGKTTFLSRLPDEDEAFQTWTESWEKMVIDQCLNRAQFEVEPRTWQAFEMLALQNQPVESVVETLGLSRNAVYVAKHRVLKRLRQLREEFDELTNSATE